MDGVELEPTSDSTVRNMTISDSRLNPVFFSGMGILVFEGVNNTISHNRPLGNDLGILMFGGEGHRIQKNIANDNEVSGIQAGSVQNTTFTRNRANRNGNGGIVLSGIGRGNVVRGNFANENGLAGISLVGFGTGSPPEVVVPIPEGNCISRNIALANGFFDLVEGIFIPVDGSAFVEDGAPCRNTWKKNRFSTELGPNMCIGAPVELVNDDFCALNDDD